MKSYIGAIKSLSSSYSKNKKYEKSKLYNDIGIKECKKYKDYTHYSYLKMLEGIADFHLKNYEEATKNLLFVEQEFKNNKDYSNLGITYYFLGKIKEQTRREKEAITYFSKMDSTSFTSLHDKNITC